MWGWAQNRLSLQKLAAVQLISFFFLSAGWLFPQEVSKERPPALDNPVVRDYFRQSYSGRTTRPGFASHYTFRESWVDIQILHFLDELETKIQGLHSHLISAENLREEILELGETGGQPGTYQDLISNLNRELKRTEDLADDLRDRLALIFRKLDNKKKLEYEIQPESAKAFYREELAFVRDQLEGAVTQVRSYLFWSENTVRRGDLQGQNMLIRLYWAQEVLKRVRQELK